MYNKRLRSFFSRQNENVAGYKSLDASNTTHNLLFALTLADWLTNWNIWNRRGQAGARSPGDCCASCEVVNHRLGTVDMKGIHMEREVRIKNSTLIHCWIDTTHILWKVFWNVKSQISCVAPLQCCRRKSGKFILKESQPFWQLKVKSVFPLKINFQDCPTECKRQILGT